MEKAIWKRISDDQIQLSLSQGFSMNIITSWSKEGVYDLFFSSENYDESMILGAYGSANLAKAEAWSFLERLKTVLETALEA